MLLEPHLLLMNHGYEMGFKLPRALTIEEIHDLVEKFGDAALRAKKAGFEVIEIHGAAGCIPTNFYHHMIISVLICMVEACIIV